MRILFDGFWWVDGPVSNKQVMREFILAWERQFAEDELFVAVPGRHAALARSELPQRVRVVATRLRPQGVSAIVELPFVGRRVRADRIITHNFTPAFGNSAVFIHDLMFITHPEWFTPTERAYYRLMPMTVGRARRVLTSTSTEAKRISAVLRGHPTVAAIGLGLSRGLEDAEPARPEGIDADGQFLLAVGRINIRKNLETTIRAAMESGVTTPSTPLLIVGEPGGKGVDLGREVADAVETGEIRFLGFLSDAELSWLYSHARVFVFLSLDEGFGMPTLEAAHFGAPVVASDIPVFREILGDHARYVDPLDVRAAAHAISASWSAGRLDPLDIDGLGYSWERSAARIRSAIEGQ